MNGAAVVDGRARRPPVTNEFRLLENGEEYYPAVFTEIKRAQREILIETFILFEDAVGNELRTLLIAAARRGVSVDLTVDDYGSPDLSAAFIGALIAAGVRLHIYDPRPRLFGMRTNVFRRLHRKIVVVDGGIAFIGGINFGVDHLLSSGEEAKQDYAVRIEGPLAQDIRRFAQQQVAGIDDERPWWPHLRHRYRRHAAREAADNALFVIRDNDRHRDDIERHYRAAIRSAKRVIVIACAYFFPGYRLLRQLRLAARRGVSVKLILQGMPDLPQAKSWAMLLYPSLLEAGIEVHEYCQRPMHAKVAVIDDRWATIGSSNLDPVSLSLNLEANVVIRAVEFNRELRSRLEALLTKDCRQVGRDSMPRGSFRLLLGNLVAYHCTRHFPTWAGWLPGHLPKLRSVDSRKTNRLRELRPQKLLSEEPCSKKPRRRFGTLSDHFGN